MKLLVSWLREYTPAPLPTGELASLLSMRGFEVAGIEGAGDAAVIDFEITANRPDCLSVVGLAREAATACRAPLRLPWDEAGRPVSLARPIPAPTASTLAAEGLAVTIEDADLCPRYSAAVAEVRIAPSPAWLADRLAAAGVRPINNLVDVTNYVLLEMGHPMHAFDLERLAGRELRARRARGGERIRTLDGEARTLEDGMLVIADAASPQAVAGVMGGAESEVWSGTRRVAFESAYFKPASVRRTSKRLGLKSEASSRFERGTDINAPLAALERACALIEQIGAGRRVGAPIDVYPAPRGPITVTLRRASIDRLIGTTVDDAEVVRIFTGLGFAVTPTEAGWQARIPTNRVDIAREADLVEEVARHHGYDKVPSHFPALRAAAPRPEPGIARNGLIRHVLTAAGFSEAVCYAFIGVADAAPFVEEGQQAVPLAYPLSENFAVLRPSLLPGLADAVAHNRRHDMRDVRLFEVGGTFSATRGEEHRFAFAWTGSGTPGHWGSHERPVDFFDAKGVIERLGEALRLPLTFSRVTLPYLAPGRSAAVASGGTTVGVLGQLAPALAAARDLPAGDDVYVAELDLDAIGRLVPAHDAPFEPLPRFPSIVRDISIVVDDALPAERVRATIRGVAPGTLVSIDEFDRYKGKGIPEGRCSLSLRLTFRSPERTLTDADAQEAMGRIVEALAREHGAVQR